MVLRIQLMTDREEVGRLGGVALQRLHLLGLDAM